MKRTLSKRWTLGLATLGALAVIMAPAMLITPASAEDRSELHARWTGTLLVQLAVSDLDQAIEFYTETLGFRLEERNDDLNWARIDVGIPQITIGLGAGIEPKGSGTVSLNFGIMDIKSVRAELEAKGVEFLGPTIEIPGVVQLADFHDPDGNKIRLAGHASGFGEDL